MKEEETLRKIIEATKNTRRRKRRNSKQQQQECIEKKEEEEKRRAFMENRVNKCNSKKRSIKLEETSTWTLKKLNEAVEEVIETEQQRPQGNETCSKIEKKNTMEDNGNDDHEKTKSVEEEEEEEIEYEQEQGRTESWERKEKKQEKRKVEEQQQPSWKGIQNEMHHGEATYEELKQKVREYNYMQAYEASSKIYIELINKYNDYDAMYNMGVRWLRGMGVQQNTKKAFECYLTLWRKYAKNDHFLTTLATSFLYKKDGNLFNEISYVILRQCAEVGCIEAMYTLGVMYRDGIYVKKNDEIALSYFQRASEQGEHASSMNNIGLIYAQGINGGEPDHHAAFYYIEKAAQQDEPKGCFNLALLFEIGQGCQRNLEKAKHYFEKSYQYGFQMAKERYEDVINTMIKEQSSLGSL